MLASWRHYSLELQKVVQMAIYLDAFLDFFAMRCWVSGLSFCGAKVCLLPVSRVSPSNDVNVVEHGEIMDSDSDEEEGSKKSGLDEFDSDGNPIPKSKKQKEECKQQWEMDIFEQYFN